MTDRLYSRLDGTVRLADKLDKPLLDNRSYRVIRLPNQLEALLIHDPETDKASAAMDVDVGSLADDEAMQGMAHAVEHLLFMGTEKYPGENDYNQYLTKYAGHSNAFTAPTSTNYYFELSASSKSNSRGSSTNTSQASLPAAKVEKNEAPLYGGLDRFAQFFIKPLFLEDTLDRELRAVDSENKKNLQSDNWRLMQLSKSLSSQNHPYHLFSTGNYKLLHDDPISRGVKIRDEFIKFYQKHYSANRMKLCVVGTEPLDLLQEWVEEFFSPIVNQNLPQLRWDNVPAQTPEELGLQIFVKPVMDQRMLDISFPYPDEEDLYESKPGRYISHLIGHEGPGSILAYLKEKGWANELSAGSQSVCPGTAFFSVGIRMTTDGLTHYRDIIKAVFQYISMIRDEPPKEWIFEESAKLAEIEFKFRQQIPASRTTSSLSGVMQKPLPRDWLLSGQYLIRKFDPDAIRRGLDALRPDNFRFTLVSKDFPGDWNQKEKWYGTEYKSEKIPSDFMKELEATIKAPASQRPAELHLPHKNEFIPTRLDVERKDVLEPATSPKIVRNEQNVRVWWKKDDQFWVPKANLYVRLRSPFVKASPFTITLCALYRDLINDELTSYAYDAELAGLDYAVSRNGGSVEIMVSGYNDKMHVLLEKVLTTARDLEVRQERFDIVKERLARGWKNYYYWEPFRQINNYTRWLNRNEDWLNKDLLDELEVVTLDDVKAFIPQFLRQLHIEVFAHGNLYKEDALRIADMVQATLKPIPYPQRQWISERYVALPPGSDYLYEQKLENEDNVNHCIEYVTHIGSAQDRTLRAKTLLLSQMMEEPVFDTLRTKEQLGYIVGGGALVFSAHKLAHRVIVQSEKDCGFLEKRIDKFFEAYEEQLRDMPLKEFEEHKIGVINKRLEKLKNLNEESGRLWAHISNEVFDFELVYRDVENIEPLTKQDIVDFFVHYFKPGSPTRAKHAVHLIAQASAEDIAAKLDPKEQRDSLADGIAQMFSQLGIEVDAAALSSNLEKVDVAKGDVEGIISSVGEYLKTGAGLAAEQVTAITDQAQAVLPQLLPQFGIHVPSAEVGPETTNGHVNGEVNGEAAARKPPVLIEEIKAFRNSLPLTPAPAPVKALEEFEDLEAKL